MEDFSNHYQIVKAENQIPQKWAVLVHGFLGSGRNLMGLAKKWVAKDRKLGILLPDLRLHGKNYSPESVALHNPPHTIDSAASDVLSLSLKLKINLEILVGHSLGGKVVLDLASKIPEKSLKKIVVLDTTPAAVSHDRESFQILNILMKYSAPTATRSEMIAQLKREGLSETVCQWLAQNLRTTSNGVMWNIDFFGLKQLLEDFCKIDQCAWISDKSSKFPIHFVKAKQSTHVGQGVLEAIPGIHIHLVSGGHWVHVEAESQVLDILVQE